MSAASTSAVKVYGSGWTGPGQCSPARTGSAGQAPDTAPRSMPRCLGHFNLDRHIKALRDPTRGGLATAINEICHASGTGALLTEAAIPIRRPVEAACEILGVDPLYLANEGKLIAIVAAEDADLTLRALRAHPLGCDAAKIGKIVEDPDGFVQMETPIGGRRMVDWLVGDPLPRIC